MCVNLYHTVGTATEEGCHGNPAGRDVGKHDRRPRPLSRSHRQANGRSREIDQKSFDGAARSVGWSPGVAGGPPGGDTGDGE